jgi:site-specific DNA-methyltransferase (adenine-specific)
MIMAHQSEKSNKLNIITKRIYDYRDIDTSSASNSDVWLLALPFGRRVSDVEKSCEWFRYLNEFVSGLGENSVLAILTTAEDAANTWPRISQAMRFQLWVALKLNMPLTISEQRLPENHAALLIMSKYRSSLKHNKTRIAYTYCPECEKTTKDYGGKKHVYHEYGTLMSDIWRDISWTPNQESEDIENRLADLFGLEPHQNLNVYYLFDDRYLRPNIQQKPYSKTDIKRDVFEEPITARRESSLINADCIETLKLIPDNSVDFCFADPPYNIDKRYDGYDDSLDIIEYFNWCDEWINELARVLKPGRTCAILNIPQWSIRHFTHLCGLLDFQNWIVWEGLSLPVRMIMPAHYSIICFSKGPARHLPFTDKGIKDKLDEQAMHALKEGYCLRSYCIDRRITKNIQDRQLVTDLWWDIHRLKHNCHRVDHPCQLPPALMRRLVSIFTRPDEIVLDPFNGVGTTSLCAEQMGRRSIGIELSEQYYRTALSRHEMLYQGKDPFAKNGDIPKAKNSRVKRIGSYNYEVSKKALQLEVREIARKLGRLPNRDEVKEHSNYPIRYFDDYFVSWAEVCAAARTTGMKESKSEDKQLSLFQAP